MNEKEKELIEEAALRYGYSYEEVQQAFESVKQTFISAFEAIKEIVSKIADCIVRRDETEKHRKHWRIPMDTTKPSQVRMPNVNLPRIRNHI